MSRTYGGNVNASLIREGRLILQQILRYKRTVGFFAPEPAKPAAPTLVLKCCRCVAMKKSGAKMHVNDAVTIFDGAAVCEGHL